MREVSKELWSEVLEVVTAITWGPDWSEPDAKVAEAQVAQLRAIYERQEALGQPEPFLTEALAECIDDARGYPDEPTHTKRICMASQLIELGELAEARSELLLGRAEAERLNDGDYVALADELLAKAAV